jgi:cytochrome c-type biogenesis protein CcmH
MNASTDWTSAIAILAAGLILGPLILFVSRRRKTAAEAPAAPRHRTAAAGFAWGVVCTLVAGGIVWYGSTFARERGTQVDVEQQVAAAKDALSRNDLTTSFERSKAVLAVDPNEPRALTYNAVVRMAMGEMDGARTMLEQATQRDPKLLEAWVALASARMNAGDQKGATAAIDAAIAQHPEEEKRLREVFAQLQKPATATPPDHPPLPTAESSPQPIHITLSLDASSTVKSGIVYVIARGAEAGHPLAVRRVEVARFPLSVDLGGSDTMMGQPMPATVRIEARLDSDGDAGTNDPGDPHAFADGVAAGSAVELTLAKAN